MIRMLTKFVPDYQFFYLQGRDADKPRNLGLDMREIALKAIEGPEDLNTIIRAAVALAMKPLEQGPKRSEWLADENNVANIKDAGGDQDLAYAHFLQGRIDEHTYLITNRVLEEMNDELSEGDGDEEGDEEEDDDEEDDDVEHLGKDGPT